MGKMQKIINHKLVKALQASSTENQIDFLAGALQEGRVSKFKLREELSKQAHVELAKGKNKLQKNGQPLTVQALLEDYYKEKKFQKLASDVGLDENWFISLAQSVIPKVNK